MDRHKFVQNSFLFPVTRCTSSHIFYFFIFSNSLVLEAKWKLCAKVVSVLLDFLSFSLGFLPIIIFIFMF